MTTRDKSSDSFPPGEPPAAAQPATERRYFTNVNGYKDSTAYVFNDERGCFGVNRDGNAWLYTAARLKYWLQLVQKGEWRELTADEAKALLSLHPPAFAVQPATDEQTDYQAALTALPDTLGRPLARRIEIVLEGLRRESHIGCELRRELDGGIERDAKAIEAQWPDAAKYLRSHAHIEDGV